MAKKLPAVPSDLPVALRNWCYSAAKSIDALDGSTGGGAGVDFALRTDVKDILLRVGDHDDTIGGHDEILGDGADIDFITVPDAPESFTTSVVGELIGLLWTYPEGYGPGLGHKRTLIYRAPGKDANGDIIDIGLVSPLMDTTYLIGYSDTWGFSEIVGYDEAFYYWVQFETTGGVLGTVSDVVLGQTDISISERMKAASDYIDGTSLAQDLRSTINSVFTGVNPPTAKADNTALVTGDTWIADDGNVYMWITNQWVSKTIATDITVIEAEVAAQLVPYALDGLTVIHYESTQPTLVSHPKLDTDDLWYNTTTGKSYRCTNKSIPTWTEVVNQDISTALGNASTAQTTADKKIQFFNTASEPGNTTANDLGFGDIWYKPGTATVGAVLKYWNNYSWVDTLMASQKFVSATVETEVTEVTGYCTSPTTGALWTGYPKKTQCQAVGGTWVDNSALAMLVTTLNTTVGGFSTTLQQDYVSQAGISGKYSVKIDNNGVVSGFGLSSGPDLAGGVKSDFIINADNFAILGRLANGQLSTNPADAINPFMVLYENGVYNTYIDNAYIKETTTNNLTVNDLASLNNVTIAGGAFTNVGADGATLPDQQIRITNLSIDTGQVTGTLFSKELNQGAKIGWSLNPNGTAYFGSDTTIDGTVNALAINSSAKSRDVHGYLMPLVTNIAFTHPSQSLDMAWFWFAAPWTLLHAFPVLDPAGYVGEGNYWGTVEWPHAWSSTGSGIGVYTQFYYKYARDYPFGQYDKPVAQWPSTLRTGYSVNAAYGNYFQDTTTPAWDTQTINEVSSTYWFGTSSYLTESRRIKSLNPIIVVTASSTAVYGDGDGGGGTLDTGASVPVSVHVKYGYLSSSTASTDHGWYEFPHGIAAALGGSATVVGGVMTWYGPSSLNQNLVLKLGTSTRRSASTSELTYSASAALNIGSSGIPTYYNGPRVPNSSITPAVVLSINVDNL